MKISEELHRKMQSKMAALRKDRLPVWQLWRELADFYLPRRYVWLQSEREQRVRNAKNPNILDSTGTIAARVLASGMMNGITSPARPWFTLGIHGVDDDADYEAKIWLDEVTTRILRVMGESNFYNSMAVTYLDLVIFGTAAQLIYEDFQNVINCYNPPLGEYYLAQDDRLRPNTFAREFCYKADQVVQWFGLENCSDRVKNAIQQGGANTQIDVKLSHLLEPNDDNAGSVPKKFKFRETYWETSESNGSVLTMRGFNELPGIFPRWELTGNDSYGSGPGMNALADVIQLQHETKKKAQGLDKMVSPPVIADIQLKHQPTALMPNGITYVAGAQNVGVKPAYQVQIPIDQLGADIQQVQTRVREIFHNDLFQMISQLDTVRSAAEIDARREEKLVLLGSVLERFENEALDPAIDRIYNIMLRGNLLPEPPQSIANHDLEIRYVSILSSAQSAVAAVPLERWLGFLGQIIPVAPQTANIPAWEDLVRNYGKSIGVPAKNMNSRQVTAQMTEQQQELQEQREQAAQGQVLVDSAKQLSETDVGGGANALQRVIGG